MVTAHAALTEQHAALVAEHAMLAASAPAPGSHSEPPPEQPVAGSLATGAEPEGRAGVGHEVHQELEELRSAHASLREKHGTLVAAFKELRELHAALSAAHAQLQARAQAQEEGPDLERAHLMEGLRFLEVLGRGLGCKHHQHVTTMLTLTSTLILNGVRPAAHGRGTRGSPVGRGAGLGLCLCQVRPLGSKEGRCTTNPMHVCWHWC